MVANPISIGTAAPVGSATTIPLTTTASVPAGGRILLFLSWYDGGLTVTISSISDGTNIYTVDKTQTPISGGGHAAVISAPCPSGLVSGSTITVTMSGAVTDRVLCGAYSTGIVATNAAYGAVGQGQNSNTVWTSTTTTALKGDLLWGGSHWEDSGGSTNTPSGGNTELHDGIGSSGTFTTTCYQVGTGAAIAASGTWSLISGAVEGTTSIAVVYRASVVSSYTPVRIPNRNVGPMALRHTFRQPYMPLYNSPVSGSIFNQALTATVTSLSSFQNMVNKGMSATSTSTASIVRLVNKNLSATATSTASFLKTTNKSLSATASSTASIAFPILRSVVMSATASSTAVIKKVVNKIMSPTSTTSSAVTKTAQKNISATATSSASIVKVVAKRMVASVSSTASLVATFVSGGGAIVHSLTMSAGVTVTAKFKMLIPYGSQISKKAITLAIDSFNIFRR